jgi:hypothetical protein
MSKAAPVRFRDRVACGVIVAAVITTFAWNGLTATHRGEGAGDFIWSIQEARAILHGQNPYTGRYGFEAVPYPLTAALIGIPFCGFSPEIAGSLFIGISCGLLGFALTRQGWNRLLVLVSYPFWSAVVSIQFSPLVTAAGLLPWLYPAVTAKPNIGFPVAVKAISRRAALAAAAFTLVTLIIQPAWPLTWFKATRGYQNFIPLLTGIGLLLLLALLWIRRDADSRFLLLMGVVPQRWYYDALVLWLIPASTAELAAASLLSWGALIATPHTRTIQQVAVISTLFNYLPMLAILLIRHRPGHFFRKFSKPGPPE